MDRYEDRRTPWGTVCFKGATYAAIVYPFISIFFDALNFASVIIGISISIPLMLIWIGFPLFAVFVRMWRASGQLQRILAQYFGGLRKSHPLLHGFEYIDENNVQLPCSTAVITLSAGDTLTRWDGAVLTMAAGDQLVLVPDRVSVLQQTAMTARQHSFKAPASSFLMHPDSRNYTKYHVPRQSPSRSSAKGRSRSQARAQRTRAALYNSRQEQSDDSTGSNDRDRSRGGRRRSRSRRHGNRGPLDEPEVVRILEGPDLDDGGSALDDGAGSPVRRSPPAGSGGKGASPGRQFVRENHGPATPQAAKSGHIEVVTVVKGADGIVRRHSNMAAPVIESPASNPRPPVTGTATTPNEPPLPPTPAHRAEAIMAAQAELDNVRYDDVTIPLTPGTGKKNKAKKNKGKKGKGVNGPPPVPLSPPPPPPPANPNAASVTHPLASPLGATAGHDGDLEQQLRAVKATEQDKPIQSSEKPITFFQSVKRDFRDPATWAAVGYFMYKLPMEAVVLSLHCVLLVIPFWFIFSALIPTSFYCDTLGWTWHWDGFRWLFEELVGNLAVLLPLGLILLYLSLWCHRALARGVAHITLRVISRKWARNQTTQAVSATEIPMSAILPAHTPGRYTSGTRQPLPALTPLSKQAKARSYDSYDDEDSDDASSEDSLSGRRTASPSRIRFADPPARTDNVDLNRSEVDQSLPYMFDQPPFASEDGSLGDDSYDNDDYSDESTPKPKRAGKRRYRSKQR